VPVAGVDKARLLTGHHPVEGVEVREVVDRALVEWGDERHRAAEEWVGHERVPEQFGIVYGQERRVRPGVRGGPFLKPPSELPGKLEHATTDQP
jgi:hypothetical protein